MTSPDVSAHGEQDQWVPPSLPDLESPSFAGQLYVPELSAKQAFVWLAVAIVPIAFNRAMSAIAATAVKHLPHGIVVADWWTRASVYFSIASFAACFVASCVLIRARCFRMLGRLQPGHWIVLLLTFQYILARIAEPFNAISFADHSPHGWAKHTFQALLWFSILAAVALWAFAAVRLRDATRWRVFLAFASANVLFWTVPFMTFPMRMSSDIVCVYIWALPYWLAILVVIALFVVVIDWPRRASRDWPHWLGVSLWTIGNFVVCMQAAVNAWQWARH